LRAAWRGNGERDGAIGRPASPPLSVAMATLAAERATQKIAGRTPECREGVSAFLEKRKARFNTL